MRSSRTRITRALAIEVPISIAIALIEHVEGAEAAAVVERVCHEIERPNLVHARRRH